MVLAPLLALASAFAEPNSAPGSAPRSAPDAAHDSARATSRDSTRDALDRLLEILELRVEEGRLRREDVLPTLLVSARPLRDSGASWFTTAAIQTLEGAFGSGGLRWCEACAAPRAFVESEAIYYQTGPVSLDEIARLDEQTRGTAPAARTATWLDESPRGVSIRIVDLRTGRVVHAQNVDPDLREYQRTQRTYTLAAEYERRARGDGLSHTFLDIALTPGQHLSFDWVDQWGRTNDQLTGVTVSLIDPIGGVGFTHHTGLGFLHATVGVKAIVSVPTAIARAVGGESLLDPLLTGVGIVRVPFGRSRFAGVATVSTAGAVGVGVSMMNLRILPVIP
jgi:hypothetical protein